MNDVMDVQVQQLAAHVNHLKSQLARAEADYENAVMAQYFHRAALKAGDLSWAIVHLKSSLIMRGKSSESLWVLPTKPLIPFSFEPDPALR
jgi:hypothetical protein